MTEAQWAGEFGNTYTQRNPHAGVGREPFWTWLLEKYPAQRVLEVGCHVGANLQLIGGDTYGVDINRPAITTLWATSERANALVGSARELPFRDSWFDLVFTVGLLMLQSEDTLPVVMAEIVRCSRRYVLCGEYYAPETVEIPYHGQRDVLFKRDYGRIYSEMGLHMVEQGFLGRPDWDDVSWWLLEK